MKLCRVGDILVSVRAPVGAMNVADRDYCIGRGLAAIRIGGMSPSLAAHLVSAAAPALRRVAQGTTFEAISKRDLASLLVQVPPTDDRAPLTRVLNTLDTTIRQTEAIIEKLKQVKQGLLHDLLTRGIDANGELRPPQSDAPHLYKESALGWIPCDWAASSIGKSCEVHNGLRLPIASEIRGQMLGDYPYYGPTGVLGYINQFRINGTFVLIGEDGDHFLKFDSWSMTQLVSGKFNVNNHAHLLSGRDCMTEWIHIWFRHRDITLFLTRQGAGRFKLNKESLLRLPMPAPPAAEQRTIREALGAFDARLEREFDRRAKLLSVKAGLMDDLLTGRVRVTPLLDGASP